MRLFEQMNHKGPFCYGFD